ncbi:MAG: hypothetical protein ACLFNO_02865 [Parcubacteria group bacterium]
MKNLFYLFVTISIALIFSSCSTYEYQLGSMSIEDQERKVALFNKQEKKQLQMEKMQSRQKTDNQDDLLSQADKNSLLRIKESRIEVLEEMAQQDQKRSIRVKSHDGYEAAYFYQAVNAGSVDRNAKESSQMNLLLMNKTRKRTSYRSTDPYSVDAKIYLVKPKEAKPGFSIREAKIIRQVATVRLEAEGKKVLELPSGFYVIDFIYEGKSVWQSRVSMLSEHKVLVSSEDLRGTNYTSQDIDNFAYVNL